MTEHVDKARLQTDLRYRFDFLSKFIDFNQRDIEMFNQLTTIIFPQLPSIVETIYKKLYFYDVTREYFLLRHDGFQTYSPSKDSGLTLDSVQIDYRKDMLTVFLKHVLSQRDWNDSFLEYLSRVGEIHTNRGGSSSINVDYFFVNALLCLLENLFLDLIWNNDNYNQQQKRLAITSVNKFFWIQNHFFTMQYDLAFQSKQVSSVSTVNFSRCLFFK